VFIFKTCSLNVAAHIFDEDQLAWIPRSADLRRCVIERDHLRLVFNVFSVYQSKIRISIGKDADIVTSNSKRIIRFLEAAELQGARVRLRKFCFVVRFHLLVGIVSEVVLDGLPVGALDVISAQN